ncbi:unnamed protein product [Anisakis simplex]|uniref:Secreted protein n=1 Tax=Anisakis simplex TaxID=6269 RepID=A0A0M3K9F2_ANISI|nr:unnamed protein product [Anisakis simplex]
MLSICTGIVLLTLAEIGSGQMMMPIDCSQAPLGFQQLCYQLQAMDRMSRQRWIINQQAEQQQRLLQAPLVPGEQWLSPATPQRSFQPSAFDCLDLQCLCPYFQVSRYSALLVILMIIALRSSLSSTNFLISVN